MNRKELFVNNNEEESQNENITYLSNGLTLYYSVFSNLSYDTKTGNNGDMKKWYNISPFFRTNDTNSCSLMKYNETHMVFFNTPTFSRNDGLLLGNNYITGPMSYTLGISGNTQYSIFIFIKFMSITNSTNDIELFQIFGNTQNLNGIRLYFSGNNTDSVSKDISGSNMYLQIANNVPIQCVKEGSRNIMFTHNKPYLFVMTFNNSNIKLSLYQSLNENKIEIINAPVSSQMYDVSFSNKNMMINQYQNINGNVYAFGIYNKMLNDDDMISLQKHLFSQIQVLDPIVVEKNKIIDNLKSNITTLQSCPYDKITCESCKSITDWTNVQAIITTKDVECLEAINKFCMDNPSHYMCKCWNSNDNSYTSTQCTNFRNVFTNKSCVDIDNMNKTDLFKVKSTYNLCSCNEETVNLQPLKIPEIDKFKIPAISISEGNSCSQGNTQTTETNDNTNNENNHEDTDNDVMNPNGAFSGYTGDTTSKIVNYHKLPAKHNSLTLAAKNATLARNALKAPVKRIPDLFADIDTSRIPNNTNTNANVNNNSDETLKNFWNTNMFNIK